MPFESIFNRGNPASSNYYKSPLQSMRDKFAQRREDYTNRLQQRAEQVRALESAGMTSPEYQLQKYIWQSNEQMMPFYEQQQQQSAYQPMQPWQIYAGQTQQPQAYSQGGTGAGQGVLSGTVAPVDYQTQQTEQQPYTLSQAQTTNPYYSNQTASYYNAPSILSGGLW